MKTRINLKEGVLVDDLLQLHPNMFILLSFWLNFAKLHGLPTELTSIHADRQITNQRPPHSDYRAVDFSIDGWSQVHIYKFMIEANRKHGDIAALSRRTGTPVAVVFGDEDHLDHVHMQVRP